MINLDHGETPWKYFYCDTATSCIIVIVAGRNKAGNRCAAISSLSSSERFDAFGRLIERNFSGKVSVFAHVTNLPLHRKDKSGKGYLSAVHNMGTVNRWVSRHAIAKQEEDSLPGFTVERATLLLGESSMVEFSENQDCYGVDISDGSPVVVNKCFCLSLKDRDPSGGLQSLFCSWGTLLEPPMLLVRASSVFDPYDHSSLISNQRRLLDIAHRNNYERYEALSDDEILEECSSAPYHESPWFCDAVRDASRFVRLNYKGAAIQ